VINELRGCSTDQPRDKGVFRDRNATELLPTRRVPGMRYKLGKPLMTGGADLGLHQTIDRMLLRNESSAHFGVTFRALEFALENESVSALEMPVSWALRD
jgi:hypothetical protein